MPNTRTSDENSAAALDGTELVRIVQAGGNAKATTAAFASLASIGLVISSIAALRLLPMSGSGRAFVLGYYANGDGGGGPYYYDPADTTSADNGGTIIVAADAGRWKLAHTGTVSAMQFGARGDGASDDTAAINAAVTACRSVYFPGGHTFMVTNAIATPSNTTLYGDGWASVIKTVTMANGGSGNGQRIIAIEGVSNVNVRDLALDNSGITVFSSGNRAINASGSSNYTIERVYAKVNGALIGSIGCSNYRVINNEIFFSSSDSAAHNNGMIDNWGGSNNFLIHGNHINGNSIGQYGVLVTGLATDGTTATPCFQFTISNNRINNCSQNGIWVQGRSGLCYEFAVSNNVVDTAVFYGIAGSDSYDFTVNGNVVKNTGSNNLRLFNETPGTWTNPNYGARQCSVTGNIFEGSNTSASSNNDTGSAVSITDASQAVSFTSNVIRGSAHRYYMFLGTNSTGIDVKGEQMQAGTVGTILNQSSSAATNTIPGGNTTTPTLTAVQNVAASTAYATTLFRREGGTVYFSGRVDITPTANATTTQLGISIPIASNFANNYDAAGTANTQFGVIAAINADTTNKRLQLQWTSTNTSNNAFYFSGSYIVR